MVALAGAVITFGPYLLMQAAQGGDGSSSTAAIAALIVGVSSALAAVFSIVRQYMGDKRTSRTADTSVTIEATKVSFDQLMTTIKFQHERIIALDADVLSRDATIRSQTATLRQQAETIEELTNRLEDIEGDAP